MEIHSVKWPPVYVEHTLSKNDTFQRASRLHQMHIRKIECRLAYGKCYLFWKSDVPSTPNAHFGGRANPNGAEQGRAGWWWPRVTDSPITQNWFCQKKRSVSSTPNAYFSGFQNLKHCECVVHPILPRNCTLQRASRLRKTYFFDKLHFPTSVSSTPNAHFENKVSSRLHQMPAFLKTWRLVYTESILGEADPPSGENQDVDFWSNNGKCSS